MSQAMVRLLQNTDLAAALGKTARKHIERNYSISRHLGLLEQSIKTALA
jgi:hypothetical protein